jgi:hypothetical protein
MVVSYEQVQEIREFRQIALEPYGVEYIPYVDAIGLYCSKHPEAEHLCTPVKLGEYVYYKCQESIIPQMVKWMRAESLIIDIPSSGIVEADTNSRCKILSPTTSTPLRGQTPTLKRPIRQTKLAFPTPKHTFTPEGEECDVAKISVVEAKISVVEAPVDTTAQAKLIAKCLTLHTAPADHNCCYHALAKSLSMLVKRKSKTDLNVSYMQIKDHIAKHMQTCYKHTTTGTKKESESLSRETL